MRIKYSDICSKLYPKSHKPKKVVFIEKQTKRLIRILKFKDIFPTLKSKPLLRIHKHLNERYFCWSFVFHFWSRIFNTILLLHFTICEERRIPLFYLKSGSLNRLNNAFRNTFSNMSQLSYRLFCRQNSFSPLFNLKTYFDSNLKTWSLSTMFWLFVTLFEEIKVKTRLMFESMSQIIWLFVI